MENPSTFIPLNLDSTGAKRLFIGIPIDNEILNELIHYQSYFKTEVPIRLTPASNLHVTTCFLGSTPTSDIPAMENFLCKQALATKPFSLIPESYLYYPTLRPYMLWLRFVAHATFNQIAEAQHQQFCIQTSKPHVHQPHATLGRFSKTNFNKLPALPLLKPMQRLQVNKLVLYESVLLPYQKPQYLKLNTYPLHQG